MCVMLRLRTASEFAVAANIAQTGPSALAEPLLAAAPDRRQD